MKHFMEYVKASYQLIMIAESKASVNLDHNIEAYVVHTFARYMEQPNIPTDSVAIKLMTAVNSNGELRKQRLQTVCEECLLIDGLELNSRRWPSRNYYRDMGCTALEYRSICDNPPDTLYSNVAKQFTVISRVLHCIRG